MALLATAFINAQVNQNLDDVYDIVLNVLNIHHVLRLSIRHLLRLVFFNIIDDDLPIHHTDPLPSHTVAAGRDRPYKLFLFILKFFFDSVLYFNDVCFDVEFGYAYIWKIISVRFQNTTTLCNNFKPPCDFGVFRFDYTSYERRQQRILFDSTSLLDVFNSPRFALIYLPTIHSSNIFYNLDSKRHSSLLHITCLHMKHCNQ
ncbi:hypothetical protein CORC01_07528 [Colletotrichum orchidophilum]|uniref:Uncharacterized protein n=1 Tax=Colletotrichum orchidophilum TaxID=1209926 RepID=A0A1G4B6R1_9PEZI|nr:uncharacterized protein CORC01_07528 [Colletotrichum orchidophilum]OHE97087.1 hypothetical protein CORC01_07528 [Colletotrichum orchidophilum]